MVRNIGYSRSYGSSSVESVPNGKPAQRSFPRAVAKKRIPEDVRASSGDKDETAKKQFERSVGAVVSLALEGEQLPLDVAHHLLNHGVQSEVIGRVHGSLTKLSTTGVDVDMIHAGEVLSALDETVLTRIKSNKA